MSESFRYLINVDQCLNISNYDMFFYKLKDQRRFRFFETAGTSLAQAIDDAGQYLRRYTYETQQTQLIFAVRKRPGKDRTWDDTLLCQILKIRDEVLNGRIDMSGRDGNDRAVVLMTVYDVGFDDSWSYDDDYFRGSGRRFAEDCRAMLHAVSLTDPEKRSSEELQSRIEELQNSGKEEDRIISELLREFTDIWNKDQEVAQGEGFLQQFEEETEKDVFLIKLVQFISEKLANYVVLEQSIRNNDLRDSNRTFLRIVEYVNSSTDGQREEGSFRNDTLADRCRSNWAKIKEDEGLESRYAKVLSLYEQRLLSLSRELEDKKGASKGGNELPLKAVPDDDSIRTRDEHFSTGQRNTRDMSLIKDLDAYRDACLHDLDSITDWTGKDGAYSRLTSDLSSMEKDLNTYAESLSKVYTQSIEARIRDTSEWERTVYEVPDNVQETIIGTQAEIDSRMKQLKEPGTSASLKFQDQLNMTGALDQSSQSITLLTQRYHDFRSRTFLTVLLVTAGAFIAHYYILQNYVLDTAGDVMLSLGYIALVLILGVTAWASARKTYRQKIKKEIEKLESGIEEYLKGYFEKANKFSRHVNLLNQLDYLHRYAALLEKVRRESANMRQLLEWHRVQIKKHLDKVQAFHGLMQSVTTEYDTGDSSELIEPLLKAGEDVVGCRVYWPQTEEER